MYCVQKVIWKIERLLFLRKMALVAYIPFHRWIMMKLSTFFFKFLILLRGMDWYKRGIDCISDKTFGPLTSIFKSSLNLAQHI